jgi:hypothetical protein
VKQAMEYKIIIVSGKGKQSRQRHRAKNYPLDPQRAGDTISTPYILYYSHHIVCVLGHGGLGDGGSVSPYHTHNIKK